MFKEILCGMVICLTTSSLMADGTNISMSAARGLTINSPICELSLGSRVIACEPPWGEKYFFNSNSTFKLDITQPDSKNVSMSFTNPTRFFINDYSATVAENGEITMKMNSQPDENSDIVFEYSAMTIPDYLLSGCHYTYTDFDGNVYHEVVAIESSYETDKIAKDFKKIEFFTELGTLTIENVKGPALSIIDRRGVDFLSVKCFLVATTITVDAGEVFDSELKVTFDIDDNLTFATPLPVLEETAKLGKVEEVVKGYTQTALPMYPVPKSLTYLEGAYVPKKGATYNVNIAEFGDYDIDRLNRGFARTLNDQLGYDFVTTNDGNADVQVSFNAEIPTDGYTLLVDNKGIKIASSTARGAFHAAQTLRKLSQDGKIQAVEIIDSPDIELRSVHLCLDATSRTYYDLVTELFAPMNINAIVGEIEYVQWDATKDMGIHVENGMTVAQFTEFVQLCEDNFIEVIPLFQTLGHCGWLFKDGNNIDMAEDVNTPYAYNVSHPDTYPLMTAILDEIFAICKPRFLHIGHDEVTMIGQYPARPEHIEIGIKKLVFDDIMFYHDYAKKHDAQIMIWHDMFVTPKESGTANGGAPKFTAELRKQFPKDIIFATWRYDGTAYPEFKLLQDEGFSVIGCPWYRPGNPELVASEIHKYGALGTMITTWAGYFDSDKLLTNNFYQVEPYARSASWSWNTNPEASETDYSKVLSNILLAQADEYEAKNGRVVDISNYANLSLNKDNFPFLIENNYGFDQLPAVEYFGDVKFAIPQRDGGNAAITFYSRFNSKFAKDEVVIPLDAKAEELYVLNSSAVIMATGGDTLGTATLYYSDGSSVEHEIKYNVGVGVPFSPFSYYLSTKNSYSWEFEGKEQSIWYETITNPYPEKTITSIGFKGNTLDLGYYILGLTLSGVK